MQQTLDLIEQAEKSLRRIMKGVYPSLLHDLGLQAALERSADELNSSGIAPRELSLQIRVKGLPEGDGVLRCPWAWLFIVSSKRASATF